MLLKRTDIEAKLSRASARGLPEEKLLQEVALILQRDTEHEPA